MTTIFVFAIQNSYGDYIERWHRLKVSELKEMLDEDLWMTRDNNYILYSRKIGKHDEKTYYEYDHDLSSDPDYSLPNRKIGNGEKMYDLSCDPDYSVPKSVWKEMKKDETKKADKNEKYKECEKCDILYHNTKTRCKRCKKPLIDSEV